MLTHKSNRSDHSCVRRSKKKTMIHSFVSFWLPCDGTVQGTKVTLTSEHVQTFRAYGRPELCVPFWKSCLVSVSAQINQDVMCRALSRNILFFLSENRERPPPLPSRPCHLQDGRQQNRVLNTTSQQMFAPVQSVQTSNWIHCHVLSSAARTLGMTVIINTLV